MWDRAKIGAAEVLLRHGYSHAMVADVRREVRWWRLARRDAIVRRRSLLGGVGILWKVGGRCELVPIEVSKAGREEVSLEVLVSVVSPGTERAQYLQLPNAQVSYPYRPGYSVSGIARAAGSRASGIEIGSRVAAIRVSHASVATVPERSAFAVPPGVPLEAAALIRLGIICGHGIRLAESPPGAHICVLGAGLVGLLTQRMAVARGTAEVTVVARSKRKERVALEGGAARFLALDSDASEIDGLAAPVVIEATGDPAAIRLAVEVCASGGRVVLLGSPRGLTPDFPVEEIRAKRLTLVGAHVSTLRDCSELAGVDLERREGEAFLNDLATGRLRVDDLLGPALDPREPGLFYRSLAESRDLGAAYFDWALIPADTRLHRARLWRVPDVTGAGADLPGRPLKAPQRKRIQARHDPFGEHRGRLRIGLLGCGEIAVRNAAAIAEAPNARLVACFDPVTPLAEDLAGTWGADVAPSTRALLERDDVDAAFVCVPHHLHAPLAVEAAEAGKHVIVEKPLANDLGAAMKIVVAARDAGVTLSVCFPHRYAPHLEAARRLIEAGALGDWRGMTLKFLSQKAPSYWLGGFSGRSPSDWRASKEKAGGGVLIMNLSHYIDLVRYLTQTEVESVAARTAQTEGMPGIEETISVVARYENDALGTIVGASAAPGTPGTADLQIWGERGFVVLEPEPRIYTLRAVDGFQAERWQELGHNQPVNIRAVFISRLATAIELGREPDVTGTDGLAVQAVIEAAYRASASASDVKPEDLLAAMPA